MSQSIRTPSMPSNDANANQSPYVKCPSCGRERLQSHLIKDSNGKTFCNQLGCEASDGQRYYED